MFLEKSIKQCQLLSVFQVQAIVISIPDLLLFEIISQSRNAMYFHTCFS